MLSTFPALSASDGLFGIPFPAFEGGFTPWECQEPLFAFPHELEPVLSPPTPQEPVMSNSGSDNSSPKQVTSNSCSGPDELNLPQKICGSGSDDPDPNRPKKNCGSGSDDPSRVDSVVVDERKRRRMISNRESARRSRMRKQKHLENLRTQVNRLRIGNRELTNRFRLVTQHCHLVGRDNDRLRSESEVLRRKLWDLHQVLQVRQLQQFAALSAWPCNNTVTSMDEQNHPPS
ncbi:bZIP transcription factor RISBZ4-like [Cornus florida]|uniref:bZIP transcription factor RISBZ4-like n=1 Tax=Cornus florida TaxID=4283 RepID=UPI00289C93BD|nr:bZIP transcription factor RISBZ4-like [Cornus florida]